MIKTVVSAALPIDERLLIKKNVLSHGKSGKRICIVTGTHGDELEGQYVCFRLNQIIQQHLDKLNGTIEIYPALNPMGIDSIMRGIPNFDLDMNRMFPGDPEGTQAECTVHAILQDLKGADMVIDIHSSNIFLREVPQVRININTADRLVPYARLLNIDFIWVHEAATVLEATLAHSLNSLDTPTLVVEMGVGMRVNHGFGNRLVTGILNLMSHMGMWSDSFEPHLISHPIVSIADEVSFVNAEASGIFITEVKNNIVVNEGEEIGQIVSSLTGEVLQEVVSPTHGLLFTLRAYPVVYEGSLLARIHHL
ncbi:MAG: M14 family metallopeptidase [Bacteroides sp.]|nr:M14 family metallopeptidase [Bacteroides sp.]